MWLPARIWILAFLVVACAASAASAATISVSLGAKITDVDIAKKRATINRGSKAGLRVGADGGVYAMRGEAKGRSKQAVSIDERVARGKIVSIKDTSAVIALDTIVDTVEVGGYFSTSIDAPLPLAEAPLFLIVARGIELRLIEDLKLFVTIEEMLADPSPALRDKVIDAMIAEMKGNKEVIESVGRVDGGGKYHGKHAGKIVDELTRADLLDFFAFVEAYPVRYMNQRWTLAEIFFSWVMTGAESGERELNLRKLAPAIKAADDAAVAGDLDDARAKWNAILREVPDYVDARSRIETIDRLQIWMRALVEDADDTSRRYKLAGELFELGAYSLALQQVDALAKAKYKPYDTEVLRGRVLAFQRKWPAAEATFQRLLKEYPDGEGLAHWLAYVKAHARIARAPDEAAGYLELGQVFYDQHDWDRALKEYRKAIERKGVTQAQIDLVTRAQQKVAIETELAQHHKWGRNAINEHDLVRGREELEICLKLVDKLGNPERAKWILLSFVGAAGLASEPELELELATRRAQIVKDNEATNALGKVLMSEGRFDEAVAVANKRVPPSNYLLTKIAHARGDLVELERLAKLVDARKLSWALPYLAQIEAARGNWQDAVAHARKYEGRDGWDPAAQRTLNATLRGLQAHEALLASSSSARERLRLVRALAELGLVKEATTELGKLPADGTWRTEAWWSIADSSDDEMALAPRLAAARSGKATTPARKRRVALLEAQARLRDKPADEANRTTLAKLYIETGKNHEALAALGSLKTAPVKPAVADLMRAGREASQTSDAITMIDEATDREDYAGATKMAMDYQTLVDRTGNVSARVVARGARASILSAQGRYSEAIAIAEEAKAIVVADGDPINIANANGDIARLQAALGTSEALRTALLKTLQVCDDLDNDLCLYGTHLELGRLDSRDGRLASGIDHTRRAWTLAERLGMWLKGREPKEQLARLSYSAGRYADAEVLFRELLVETRKGLIPKTEDEIDVLLMLGAISNVLGDGKAARARFKEVYDLGTRTGNSGWRAVARRMEGNSWVTDHQPAKAVPAFEQAAALLDGASDTWSIKGRASALRGLATARLEVHELPGAPSGGLAKARAAADEALELIQRFKDRTTLVWTQLLFAEIAIAEGAADDALTRSTAALKLGTSTDDPEMLARCWHLLAKSYALKNRDADAADAYDKALQQQALVLLAVGGESVREKYMASGDGRELYTDAVEMFLKLGKTARAMDVLELSRDAQLKQAFDPAEAKTADPALRARLDKYAEERARVKALQQQIAEAANKPGAQRSETQIKTLGDLLAKSQQNLKVVASDLKGSQQAMYRVMAVDPQHLFDRRKQLPAGAVLVQYYAADDMLYAFVMSASSIKPALVSVKVKGDQLAKTVEEFRTAIIQENERVKARDKVESLGRQLDDWLLQPLRKELAGVTTIIVVPFGPLYYLPFDALVVSEPRKPVRYAVEDFRISVQTAMTIERLLEPARPRATGTLLAISNPDGSLPGAQKEVSSIVKTVPDARVLTRKQATLKKFIDVVGGYRYIHLASHGILDPDPWKSYLKLADANLTVAAIAKLDGLRTSTELVVLSACESATSAGSASADDQMSLAGGFAWAGAPAIVASLWEVGDESTAELMATFYRALEANTKDRLEALRNAKLNLLRGTQGKAAPYAAPWHWASFQLYGDFRAPP